MEGMEGGSGVGCCRVGPVTGISSGTVVEVKPGVGVARRGITGSWVEEVGAQAETIKTGTKNQVGRKGRQILSFMFNIFSTKRYQ
jgi:hypothetical protein